MAKIAIIYYSTYGHIATLAESVKEGVESVPGVTAEIYQVPETLPEEVLAKLHAAPKKDHAIATVDVLKEADGILFGFPTRFGSLPAQVKAFFDSCGGLWAAGALVGKPAGIFFSTGTQGGGQETTAFTALTFLAHQGLTCRWATAPRSSSTWTRSTADPRGAPVPWPTATALASRRSWSSRWPPRRASRSPK